VSKRNPSRKPEEASVFFEYEDECNLFLRNVGLSLNYVPFQPRRLYFRKISCPCWEINPVT
jgi:hypothetical protein